MSEAGSNRRPVKARSSAWAQQGVSVLARNVVVKIKRVYDAPADGDGFRILIDRLWPRGMAKGRAKIGFWAKSIAPSNELRRWYKHDRGKWTIFKRRYFAELDSNPIGFAELKRHISKTTVTLVFASKETGFFSAG